MKKSSIYRYSFLLMLGIGIAFSQNVTASPHAGISFQVFYNELSPFGDWVMDPVHGYVWVPYVDQGFQPYATNGYWAMTNFGNTWVSDYSWGWAPFHYGRWFFSNFYGWSWIPGYDWGPAWVSWRTGGGYYGWAPLGPGFGINASFYAPASHWVFLPRRRFRHRHFHRYFVPHYNIMNVYNSTTIINKTYVHNNNTYLTGPARRDIERATRSRVPVYQVNDSSRPGRAVVQNNRLNVYRPQVTENRSAGNASRPSRVYSADEYKQRSATQNRSNSAANGSVQTPRRNAQSSGAETRQVRPGNQSAASPSRNSAATPSRNAQVQNRQNTNREARVGNQNRIQQRQTAPRTSNSSRNPSVNSRSYQNSQVNRGAANNPTVTRQSRPASNQVARPASPQNNQRSQPAMRSNSSNRQSQPSMRSNSGNRQSQPAMRSPSNSGSSRSNSGTVSRGSSNNNSRSSSGTRGGSRGGD
ncbi:DUF6600 domain-containing protein [Aquiflexum sp.]|uniref:DUF6600 domain-containing protein n=1 Tax=Aquiflexum sp. TaxID=1872584 RepID=UPI003593C4D3